MGSGKFSAGSQEALLDPNLLYGKAGLFSSQYTAKKPAEEFDFLDHVGAMLKVMPPPSRAAGSRFFRLAFQSTHSLAEYKLPALPCCKCYLTCRNKARCTKCSDYYPYKTPEGNQCVNNPLLLSWRSLSVQQSLSCTTASSRNQWTVLITKAKYTRYQHET